MHRAPLVLATLITLLAPAAPAHAAWQWPVSGEVITPYRNGTDPYAAGQHRGIDIAAAVGATVRAAAGGEVRFAGTAGSSGLTVGIRTGDGYDTSYLHLSSLAVRAGARVSAGDRIGAVGTSGTRSAATPHLHFGVRDAGSRHAYHDPLSFLPPPPLTPRGPDAPPAPAAEPTPAPPEAAPPPSPAVAPVLQGSPQRAPVRAPVAGPGVRRAPARTGVRLPADAQVPAAWRAAPEPGGSPTPGLEGRPKPAARGWTVADAGRRTAARRPAEGGVAASKPLPERGQSAPVSATRPRSAEDARRGGPNLGWALACAGLLLAAGVLGLTSGGPARRPRAATRTRARLPRALAPRRCER